MRIRLNKELLAKVKILLGDDKSNQEYEVPNYTYKDGILSIPDRDYTLSNIIKVAERNVIIEKAPVWFEVPDSRINETIPVEVSFGGITWGDLELLTQGISNSLRYYQPFNSGIFNLSDIISIQDDNILVLSNADLDRKLQTVEYTVTPIEETIEYIDANWKYNGFFDMVAAHVRMTAVYEAKGVDDNASWDACTDDEKEIIVTWNIVGLGKAATIIPAGWSESRAIKEIGRKYREFNINMIIALERRFTDWYQYLNMILTAAGRVKFDNDWDWYIKEQYVHRNLRQFELGVINDLVTFNNDILGTYLDSDFFGTISATTIVNNLEDVLIAEEYYI